MRLRAATAALLLLALSACGGADHAQPPAGFRAKATSTCVNASKAPQKTFPFTGFDPLHPDTRKLPQIAAFYDANGWPIARMLQKQLHGLPAPGTGGHTWSAFLTAFDRYVDTYRRQIDTATRADGAAFTATAVAFRDMADDVNAAAAAAGVPRCSPFHLGQV